MLNIFKFILKPLKTEYLMILFAMKTVVMIFSICWLMAVVNAAATQQQPQSLNYKQQLQYQMQQHDKFEYQQHMKQQQQFYQQQYHQQQAPTSMALLQEQQQLEQQQKQRLQQQQQYLAVKPSQMLQTTASLQDDDNTYSEALFRLNLKKIPARFKITEGKEVNILKEKLKLIGKTEKSIVGVVNTSTSRNKTNRLTYYYNNSTTTPYTTTPTSAPTRTTTSTQLPMTTTTITSTTTASTITMNLKPNAKLDLNTEDIPKNMHTNLIESEGSFKKSLPSQRNDNERHSDLKLFSEEAIKSTKYHETSTITNEMNKHSPPSITFKSSTTTFTLPSPLNPTTENLNALTSFDIVDEPIDILELKEDDKSGNRLEHNNITLEELIEHRVRGSSQLQLSTIAESSPQFYSDEMSTLQDNMDIVTVIENLPHFSLFNLKNGKPYISETDSELTNYFASAIDIENTDEV